MRTMSWRSRLAYTAAAVTLFFGLLGLFLPGVVGNFVGLSIIETRGISEIRAVYGGLFIALGLGLLWALPRRPATRPVLLLAAMLWLGMALGRLVSILIDVIFDPLNLLYLLLEICLSAFVFLAALELDGRGEGPGPAR